MKRFTAAVFVILTGCLALTGVGVFVEAPAHAQYGAHLQPGASNRLSAYGIGEASAQPDRVMMVTTVSGHAPLAGDALVKYRDAKRRATEAIEALEIDGLAIEGQGLALHSAYDQQTINMLQQRMWNGGDAGGEIDTRPQIIVKEQLKITITGIDQLDEAALLELLIKLIETSQDAGLSVGGADTMTMINRGWGNQPMSLFAFEVSEPEKAHAEARAAAIEAAKSRARQMAEQAGVTLGPILSVDEYPVNTSQHHYQNPMQSFLMAGVIQMDGQSLGPAPTDELGPTPVKVQVNLSFGIEPANP
jgi:uncharacterized protein YggE